MSFEHKPVYSVWDRKGVYFSGLQIFAIVEIWGALKKREASWSQFLVN